MPHPPQPHKPSRRSPWAKAARVTLAGAAAGVLVAATAWEVVAIPAAERAAERRTGFAVRIGSLQPAWWPPMATVIARDVTVYGRPPFEHEVLARLERVELRLNRRLAPSAIHVEGADVELLVAAQVDNVRGRHTADAPESENDRAATVGGVPVSVTRGRLRGAVRLGDQRVTFRASAFDLSRSPSGSFAVGLRELVVDVPGAATLRWPRARLQRAEALRAHAARIEASGGSLQVPGSGALVSGLALSGQLDDDGMAVTLVRAPSPTPGRFESSLRADATRAEVVVNAEAFPLGVLAPVAERHGLVLGAAQARRFGLKASLDVPTSQVAFSVELDATGLGLRHRAIDRDAWLGLPAFVALRGSADLGERRVEISSGTVRALGAELDVGGHMSFGGGWRGSVRVATPAGGLACASLPAAQAGPVAEALRGLRLQGRLELTAAVTFDAADWENLALDLEFPSLCQPTAEPDRLRNLMATLATGTPPPPGAGHNLPMGGYHPAFLPLRAMPPHLVAAFVTAEDSQFFGHRGFMLEGIRRALAHDLAVGAFARGASTITQQLAKNLFLSNHRTLGRKLEETVLAWRLDALVPKQRLLEIYLNIIELGPGLRGVREASRAYFGKTLDELTPLEAAHLASLAPNPIGYSRRFRDGRVDDGWMRHLYDLLGMMKRTGRISVGQLAAARGARLTLRRLAGRT